MKNNSEAFCAQKFTILLLNSIYNFVIARQKKRQTQETIKISSSTQLTRTTQI